MTAEVLSAIAGIVLSLLFSYVPGLSTKFAGLSKEAKSLIMLGILAVVAGVVYGLSCTSWGAAWNISITCDQAGAQKLIGAFIAALVANQATYLISPPTPKVEAAKMK